MARQASFTKGHTPWNKDKTLSEEYRARMRGPRSSMAGSNNPMYGKPRTQEVKDAISKAQRKRFEDPEERRKLSDLNRGKTQSEETKLKKSEALKGRPAWNKGKHPHTEEAKRKISEASKRAWQNKEVVARMLTCPKPNKCEGRLISIFARYLPEFKYNGDFSLGVTLSGLIPDFVNINGKKEVIEVFGDYWHSPKITGNDWPRSELGRIMAFNSVGFKCLVIWEHELKELSEEELVNKIKAFFIRRRTSARSASSRRL